MGVCPGCGAAVADGWTFCLGCGAALGADKPRRRRGRRWYRRPLVVVPLTLLLLAGGVAGAALYRVGGAVSELRSVSTPPSTVSGDALGGDAALRIDTGPARAAVEDAGDGGGPLGGLRGAASDVGDLAGGAAAAAGLDEPDGGALTVLMVEVDAEPGAAIDVGLRPEALLVLRLDPAARSCRLLALPGDTRADLAGYGPTRLDHALALGGIPYQRQAVEGLLGLGIDRYALIDIAGYGALADALGGIEVEVAQPIPAAGIAAGWQTLDGAEAQSYARHRGTDGDAGRIKRRQGLARGLVGALAGREVAGAVGDLLPAVTGHVRTDLSPAELVGLAEQYRGVCAGDAVQVRTLRGEARRSADPVLGRSLRYNVVDEGRVRDQIAWLEGAGDRAAIASVSSRP